MGSGLWLYGHKWQFFFFIILLLFLNKGPILIFCDFLLHSFCTFIWHFELVTCFLLCSIPKSLSLAAQESHSLIAFLNGPRMSSNVLCFQICNSIEGDFLLNFVACTFHKKNPARFRICICWFSCPSGLVSSARCLIVCLLVIHSFCLLMSPLHPNC